MPIICARKDTARRQKELWPGGSPSPLCRWMTIPDDALLEIFSFYVGQTAWVEAWFTLAHVCQQWRKIVFAAPRRLNLRLLCTRYRPVREILSVWPALPIAIHDYRPEAWPAEAVDNIVAALERNDRICEINLQAIPSSLLKIYMEMMQVSLPALTSLELRSIDEMASVLPDTFLDGAAPRLRSLTLNGMLFPALPNLLLTTTDLVELSLCRTPHSGYISPEAMVTCLSSLIRLESLELGFRCPRPRPDRTSQRPPPLTRTVLPVLTYLEFRGISEYLEDLVARIDTPCLNGVHITFFNQLIFDTPQFRKFLHRAGQFGSPKRAIVTLYRNFIDVGLSPPTGVVDDEDDTGFLLRISCTQPDWQLSSAAQVCNSSLPPLSALEHLHIRQWLYPQPRVQVYMDGTQWLEFFHPFVTVKNLYLSDQIMPHVLPILRELCGEMVTEVLPALQNLFLDGPQPSGHVHKAIMSFIAARHLSGHPVAVHERNKE